jgi:hypothetical protein
MLILFMYVKICLPSSTETWGNGSPDVTSGYVRGSSRETWRGETPCQPKKAHLRGRRGPFCSPRSRRSGEGGRGRGSGSAKLAGPGGFAFPVGGGRVRRAISGNGGALSPGEITRFIIIFPPNVSQVQRSALSTKNWTRYVTMSILTGQEIARLDCDK